MAFELSIFLYFIFDQRMTTPFQIPDVSSSVNIVIYVSLK